MLPCGPNRGTKVRDLALCAFVLAHGFDQDLIGLRLSASGALQGVFQVFQPPLLFEQPLAFSAGFRPRQMRHHVTFESSSRSACCGTTVVEAVLHATADQDKLHSILTILLGYCDTRACGVKQTYQERG